MKQYPKYLPQITAGDAKRLYGVPEGTTHYWLQQEHIPSTTAVRGKKMKIQMFSRLDFEMFLFEEGAGEHRRHAQVVKIADLYADSEFSVREDIKPQLVEHYVILLENGNEPPPGVAAKFGGKMVLLSGHHRVAAAEKFGRENVMVNVLQYCEPAEAFYIARKENDGHGLPPSKGDRKKTFLAGMSRPEYRDMSVPQLATEFAYSERQVQRLRKELLEPAKKKTHASRLTLEQEALLKIKRSLEVLKQFRPTLVAKLKALIASSKKEG